MSAISALLIIAVIFATMSSLIADPQLVQAQLRLVNNEFWYSDQDLYSVQLPAGWSGPTYQQGVTVFRSPDNSHLYFVATADPQNLDKFVNFLGNILGSQDYTWKERFPARWVASQQTDGSFWVTLFVTANGKLYIQSWTTSHNNWNFIQDIGFDIHSPEELSEAEELTPRLAWNLMVSVVASGTDKTFWVKVEDSSGRVVNSGSITFPYFRTFIIMSSDIPDRAVFRVCASISGGFSETCDSQTHFDTGAVESVTLSDPRW